jgi:hypothetical protein
MDEKKSGASPRRLNGSSKPQVIAVSPRPEDSWVPIGSEDLTL